MDEPPPSLVERMTARLSGSATAAKRGEARPVRPQSVIRWSFALRLALLIAAGPVLTIVGARWLEARAQAEATRLRASIAPRIEAAARSQAARDMLRNVVRQPAFAVTLDRLASVLPQEARVARMARNLDGVTTIEITAPDPDQVRAALRRDPVFGGFREVGQRRAGSMMLVSYRGKA